MRIWSVHPEYLDARGLVSLWREALLAQAVLRGATRGYRHHPELARFRRRRSPAGAIADYLRHVHAEALVRGYRFNRYLIGPARTTARIRVTRGQLEHEWAHLRAKLGQRDPERAARCEAVALPAPHPLFRVVPGAVEAWEGPAAEFPRRRRVLPQSRMSERGPCSTGSC